MEDVYVPPPPIPVQKQDHINRLVRIIQEWDRTPFQPTYQQVVDYLNELNIPSPHGLQWKPQMLYNGLKYHGIFIHNTCPLPPPQTRDRTLPRTHRPLEKSQEEIFTRKENHNLERLQFKEILTILIQEFFQQHPPDEISPRRGPQQRRSYPWVPLAAFVNERLSSVHWTPNSIYNYCKQYGVDYRALAGPDWE